MIENILNTIALGLVMLGCVLHLVVQVDHKSPECERWGFILTGAGAFGVVATLWWPRFEYFAIGYDTFMHVGMALIGCWLVQGHLRELASYVPLLRWCDRRRAAR